MGYITRYIMTEDKMRRRENAGLSIKCNASFCGKEVKVGDRVVTKGGCMVRTKIWHEECFDKIREMAV